MEDVIRKYLCNSCLCKKKECMEYTEKEENGIRSYKCMGYIFNNSQGGTNEDNYTDNTTLKEE